MLFEYYRNERTFEYYTIRFSPIQNKVMEAAQQLICTVHTRTCNILCTSIITKYNYVHMQCTSGQGMTKIRV